MSGRMDVNMASANLSEWKRRGTCLRLKAESMLLESAFSESNTQRVAAADHTTQE